MTLCRFLVQNEIIRYRTSCDDVPAKDHVQVIG